MPNDKIKIPNYDPDNPRCDEKQLKFLKECIAKGAEGIKAWNGFREIKPDEEIWLQKANLSEAHLEYANLSFTHLENTDLRGAHLEYAKLLRTHLENAELRGAHLENALLWEVHLENANLSRTNLQGADLSWAHLLGADLSWAHLKNANLYRATLQKAKLKYVDLQDTNIAEANLKDTILDDLFMPWARIDHPHLFDLMSEWRSKISLNKLDNILIKRFLPSCVRSLLLIYPIIAEPPSSVDDEKLVPLWLKCKKAPPVQDVAIMFNLLNDLAATIRVFQREISQIPVYASVAEGTPWGEKELQEQEKKLTRMFLNPVAYIQPDERLYLYRVAEGSVFLGLGNVPKWIRDKIDKILQIMPRYKEACGEYKKRCAEAEKIRVEAKEQEEKIAPQVEQEQEKLYQMRQKRFHEDLLMSYAIINESLKNSPEEFHRLPPGTTLALAYKIYSMMEDGSQADDLVNFSLGHEGKKLPPFDTGKQEDEDLKGDEGLEIL